MRKSISRLHVYASVTVLVGFLQPLQANEALHTHTSRLRNIPEARLVELDVPDAMVGPTFYKDYLLWAASPPDIREPLVMIVMDHDAPEEFVRAVRDHADARIVVLFPAPRHDPADAARVALDATGVSPRVPRVFLRSGTITDWVASVPGAVTPLWFARLLADSSEVPFGPAQINAARLGFGRRDPPLHTVLAGDTAGARLTVKGVDDLIQVLTTLPESLDAISDTTRDVARNYLIVPWPTPLFISEFDLVRVIVGLAVVLLLYPILFPRRGRHYLRSMRHNAPAIFISFAVILASLMAANISLRLIGRIPRLSPEPLLLAGGKIALATVVLCVLAAALRRRIRRATAVYSGAAVFFLLLASIVASVVSIVLGMYFTISFVFGVIFSIGHKAWIKTLALLLSVSPVLYLVLAIAPAADQQMAAALLTPPLGQEIVTAVMLLPLLLMFFRLDGFMYRVPLLPILAMGATVGLALVTATLITQARDPDPYRLVLRDRFPPEFSTGMEHVPQSGERTLTANGLIIDEPVSIRLGGRELFTCPSVPCSQEIAVPPVPLDLTLVTTQALDRHTLTWTVTYREPAGSLNVSLETDRTVQLYATDQRMEQAVGSRGSRFDVRYGPEPPLQLSGTVVLRADELPTTVSVRVTTRFPGDAEAPEEHLQVSHQGRTWTLSAAETLE